MYRPDKNCKLCDKEFETEFTGVRSTFSAKFIPCLHQMVCTDCTKNEKYTECPFCIEPIRRVTYKQYHWDNQIGIMWRSDILYSNSE